MPREKLNRQLQHIQDEVFILGSMVEEAVFGAVNALKQRDIPLARKTYSMDSKINEKRFAIENAVLILIATQQPMAHDLRQLTAILEVITELERMGDYAKGIDKVTILLGDADIPVPIRDIESMAQCGVAMLHQALGAFINEDASLASTIPAKDAEVDAYYTKIYRSIVNAMMADPSIIDHANSILWVAHNLERLADRVTNICERTVFIATGELLEIDSSDDEDGEG